MGKFKLATFVLIFLTALPNFAETTKADFLAESNRLTNLNENWYYLESNVKRIEELEKTGWESLSLPHSWNSLDAIDVHPGYRRGAGWYKKILTNELDTLKRYFLYFEGANITTTVYVNGKKAGEHVGGYVGFEVEITPFLVESNNEIIIRVDNDQNREIIPSSKSDFFIFGGITRDVWLKAVPLNGHIDKVSISTPEVSKKIGRTEIAIRLVGEKLAGRKLNVTIYNPSDELVFQKEQTIKTKSNLVKTTIKSPELWHVSDPNLYTVKVELIEGDKSADAVTESFGYRWFDFKQNGAFYLNGERLKIRGTHRHEEHAGYGAAVPNSIHRKDIEMIKEMGANMVRLAHYPQDPEIYRACDELGIIVWDELPWCRGGLGNDAWKNNTKRLLKEMINQNYNHPSIAFWSLGNEIYWLPEFEDGDNREKINNYLTELNDIVHELDSRRFTAIRKYYEGAHIPDVFSPSIWSGWYSGKYTDYQSSVDNAIKQYDHFLHAEYGGSSHLGRHSESVKSLDENIASTLGNEAIVQVNQINYAQDGDWSENYIVDLFDWHLKVSESSDDFAGNIQWAFKDFGTPLRPENDIPYINQKGLVDREGNPKDAYYVFKSYWAEKPFTYIESKTWTERHGNDGEEKIVSVYSNCPSVSLIHNGINLGQKEKNMDVFPASGLTWGVTFEEGENSLVSIGGMGKEEVRDSLVVTYHNSPPGTPSKLILTYSPLADGRILVSATALDKNNRRCTQYEKKVYFQCIIGGRLKESYGTPTGSSVIAMANGKASVELTPDQNANSITVMVLNQDFKGTTLKIDLNNE